MMTLSFHHIALDLESILDTVMKGEASIDDVAKVESPEGLEIQLQFIQPRSQHEDRQRSKRFALDEMDYIRSSNTKMVQTDSATTSVSHPLSMGLFPSAPCSWFVLWDPSVCSPSYYPAPIYVWGFCSMGPRGRWPSNWRGIWRVWIFVATQNWASRILVWPLFAKGDEGFLEWKWIKPNSFENLPAATKW